MGPAPNDGHEGHLEEDSPLLPFRKSRGPEGDKFWTSKDCKDCEVLGYTYPDVLVEPEKIISKFNERYAWSLRVFQAPGKPVPHPDLPVLNVKHAQVFQYTDALQKELAKLDPWKPVIGKLPDSQLSSLLRGVSFKPRNSPKQDYFSGDAQYDEEETPHILGVVYCSLMNNPKPIRQWYIDVVVERYALKSPTPSAKLANTLKAMPLTAPSRCKTPSFLLSPMLPAYTV